MDIDEPFGGPTWASLSIEEVFTSLALLNDFSPPGTNDRALSQLLLNDLDQTGTDLATPVKLAAGAEFIVMVCGDIMTMPGLPKVPSSNVIDVSADGRIVGLF